MVTAADVYATSVSSVTGGSVYGVPTVYSVGAFAVRSRPRAGVSAPASMQIRFFGPATETNGVAATGS